MPSPLVSAAQFEVAEFFRSGSLTSVSSRPELLPAQSVAVAWSPSLEEGLQ